MASGTVRAERSGLTARHLRCGCSPSCGRWTDALWGRTAPGRCRRRSRRSWAIRAYCHQRLHCPELDTPPSWSEDKGRIETSLRALNSIQSSSTSGVRALIIRPGCARRSALNCKKAYFPLTDSFSFFRFRHIFCIDSNFNHNDDALLLCLQNLEPRSKQSGRSNVYMTTCQTVFPSTWCW